MMGCQSYRPKLGPLALGAALAASPALAERFDCMMADGTVVRFDLDPNQFVDAVSEGEPPRRKVTQVTMGTSKFPAEPFSIGDLAGFSAEALGAGTIMFVVNPSGEAIQTERQTGQRMTGQCESLQ